MASRRNTPPAYDERFIQASRMKRLPAALHPMELPPPLVLLGKELASQEAELERLAADKRTLASSHLALRQDLVAAEREADKLREHVRSIQTEGDIQIRILLDKIAKAEADFRAGESTKRELQEAHLQVQGLATAKQELTTQMQRANKELDEARADVKKLPEMRTELDSLRQEHQRLQKTFENDKGANTKKVEQMKILEKDLISTTGEIERLHAEVSDAEKRADAPVPQIGPYMNSGTSYPPHFHENGGYGSNFGMPHFQMVGGAPSEGVYPYAGAGLAVGPPVMGGPVVAGVVMGSAGNPAWGGVYNASHTQM